MDGENAECLDVADISEGGVAAVTGGAVPTGSTVTLHFFTPRSARAVAVKARVVWSRYDGPSHRAGFHFVEVEQDELEQLKELTVFARRHRD
jgi:c-di-GMP-binding flagellar brake protein YcgR